MRKNSTNFAMQALSEQRGSSSLDDLRDDAQGSWDYSNISVSGTINSAERERMESRAFSLLSATQQNKVIDQRLRERTEQDNAEYRQNKRR